MPETTEIIVHSLPSRCPYCDAVAEYPDLRPGEHRIRCEHCQREYIKIVGPLNEVHPTDHEEK